MIYTAVTISIFALALKFVTLYRLRGLVESAPTHLYIPIIAFVGMNVTELIGFKLATAPTSTATIALGYPLLITYYVLLITAINALLALALDTSSLQRRWWVPPLTFSYCVTLFAVLVPGVGLDGWEYIGYTGTRIPGDYYYLIQLGIVIPALSIPIASAINIKQANVTQRQFGYVHLLCFAPIVVAVVLVAALMQAGLKINASAILSLAVCIPLWLLLYANSSAKRFALLCFVPFSPENKRARGLLKLIFSPTGGMKEQLKEIEKSMLIEALIKAGGNKTEAAKILGVSRTQVSTKYSKYGIDIKE